jgi:nitrogenase molybdenum-iron protein alpha/beta subunit
MKKYCAEYSDYSGPKINPVEVESESAHFVTISGRRTARETERPWGGSRYCDSFDEATRYLARQLSKKLEAVENERRKLLEAMIEVSRMEEE